jgi:NAD(P)-dependent dehydrogenase (short-subunit alcohol dehydrogenase family)
MTKSLCKSTSTSSPRSSFAQSARPQRASTASKAAIAIYTESLRHELAPFGIDVTCIEPGYFRTDFLQ